VTIAKITSTHGLKGDVRIFPIISPPELLEKIDYVFMKDDNNTLTKYVIAKVRPHKKALWLLRMEGWETIEQAELFKGKSLFLPKDEMPELPENSYYVGDLVGSSIVTKDGESVGELVDVLERGSSDLYVIKTTDDKELLLPVVREFVLSVNLNEKVITVNIPEGLRDL
jgi:16S rRNA processing protein RimM